MHIPAIEELIAQQSLLKTLPALYLALLSVASSKMEQLWGLWKADLPDDMISIERIGGTVLRIVSDC